MRTRLLRWVLSGSLAAATSLGVQTTATAQPHHDRHGPHEAPPPIKVEPVVARPGFIWAKGHWDWHDKWDWVPGRFEKERPGRRYRDHAWEKRGDEWVAVEGDWVDGGGDLRPRTAPPPLKVETVARRDGFVWIRGHWDWKTNNWDWVAGHWEAERAHKKWRDRAWELRDGAYVVVEGDWIDDGPVVAYPSGAPPAPRTENVAHREGFLWIRGHWDWKNGNWDWKAGHWEAERAGQAWVEGKWELRDGHYAFVEGRWDHHAREFPNAPPPRAPSEAVQARAGHGWIPGYYRWIPADEKYVWVPGRLEPGHGGERWEPGEWGLRGDHYVYNEGRWVGGAPVNVVIVQTAPPAPRNEVWVKKDGYLWIKGHYLYRNNAYEWVPGHEEKVRTGQTWHEHNWEKRGTGWVFVEGGWR